MDYLDPNNSQFVYRMSRLQNQPGKLGVLKPDAEGWYTMCIGALDHASRNINPKTGQAEYYSQQGFDRFFSPGTLFNDRINGGFIKAEFGHPKIEAGMSESQFLERNLAIYETMVCATFSAIWLVPNYVDPLTGEKCVGIFAKFKPSGPYGKFLEQELQTKGFNCCFSIRSLTTRKMINGRNTKVLHTVITFDYVGEPGITCAEKLVSPSLESVNHAQKIISDSCDIEVTVAAAKRVLERAESSIISVESSTLSILNDIVQYGDGIRQKTQVRNSFNW